MPYISEDQKRIYTSLIKEIEDNPANSVGQLNFLITTLIKSYMDGKDRYVVPTSKYQTINDIMGALSSAQAEFYRRVAVNYEKTKIDENGDVYDESGT